MYVDVVCMWMWYVCGCGMYVDVVCMWMYNNGGMYMLWYVHGVVCIWYGTYYSMIGI